MGLGLHGAPCMKREIQFILKKALKVGAILGFAC